MRNAKLILLCGVAATAAAQQGGTLYFVLLFVAGVGYALWPRHRDTFRQAALAPLQDDEDDHVAR